LPIDWGPRNPKKALRIIVKIQKYTETPIMYKSLFHFRVDIIGFDINGAPISNLFF
jgi:hypothetical protein